MSLAIAVINSTVFDRLTTLERSVVLVAMPFEQSLVRWLAIAAEPPLPQAKISLSPWMACLSAAAARSISDERTDVRPAATRRADSATKAPAVGNSRLGNLAAML